MTRPEPAIFRVRTRPIPRELLEQLLVLATPPPEPAPPVFTIHIRGRR